MQRGLLFQDNFHPQFTGHETFPLRYGWLKKVYDAVSSFEDEGRKDETKEIFTSDAAIARFGVGKNMVASMRHWAVAAGVIQDDSKTIRTTRLARTILANDGYDPWMENNSTTWLAHWNIATHSNKATYIYLFNYFNDHQFDREVLVQKLANLCQERGWKQSAKASLKRDVECLVRAYMNKPGKNNQFSEDLIESPLAELGLIQPLSKNELLQLKRGNQPSLGDGVFLYALVDYWQTQESNARTLSLENVCYEPGSPGRALCLNEDAVAERIYDIDRLSNGQLSWSETAGVRQVIANVALNELDPFEFLAMDYQSLSNQKAA